MTQFTSEPYVSGCPEYLADRNVSDHAAHVAHMSPRTPKPAQYHRIPRHLFESEGFQQQLKAACDKLNFADKRPRDRLSSISGRFVKLPQTIETDSFNRRQSQTPVYYYWPERYQGWSGETTSHWPASSSAIAGRHETSWGSSTIELLFAILPLLNNGATQSKDFALMDFEFGSRSASLGLAPLGPYGVS
eukprot:9360916-Pyramimonas_sp.AAC.1